MNRIAIAMLTVFVVGCSKATEDITPVYVSPVQYSNYDCDQTRNEMIRVNAQVNKLGGKLDDDAETDESVTTVGVILFWPALFFLGGTKEQEAEYARLRGEYNALEQSAIQKKCDSPEPNRLAAEQGYAPAQALYGDNLASRDEPVEALKWHRLAAEQGYAPSQTYVGLEYLQGDAGVSRDKVEALKWFNLAAAQRDEDAEYFLRVWAPSLSAEDNAKAQRLAKEWLTSHTQ